MTGDGARQLVRRAVVAVPQVSRLIAQRDELLKDRARLRAERDRLRKAVAESGKASADRENLQYLFFLTYGRSGTTLLQGVLSAAPGVLIRGENGDAVYQLFKFHDVASSYRDEKKAGRPLTPRDPWWGIDGYPDDVAYRHIRALVLDTLIRPEPDSRIVGFKEIRWSGKKDLPEYVQFVRKVFPGAKFLLNTRNHADVAKSKWWADNPNAVQRLGQIEGRLREIADGLGANAYHVHYDDYRDNPEGLRGLHEWLGIEFDAARVRAVMDTPHSY